MGFKFTTLIYFVFSSIIFPQNNCKASANVNVKLINGAMFNIVKGNLDFKGLSNSVNGELRREPPDGISLEISGNKIGEVIINYEDTEINKIYPKEDAKDKLKTSKDSFLFQPIVKASNNLIVGKEVEISNGLSLNLDKENGYSNISLLIGGSLHLPSSLIDGFYTGTFTLSLIYR